MGRNGVKGLIVLDSHELRLVCSSSSFFFFQIRILSRMLSGFNVTQAMNGQEAIERVRELILADPPLQPFSTVATEEDSIMHDSILTSPSTTPPALSSTTASAPATPSYPSTPVIGGSTIGPNSISTINGSPFHSSFSPTPQQSYVKQKGRQFDLIFSDIIMPVLDGQAASREIRKLERLYQLPPAPIVALTANAFLEDRNKCAAAGMSLFLSKVS